MQPDVVQQDLPMGLAPVDDLSQANIEQQEQYQESEVLQPDVALAQPNNVVQQNQILTQPQEQKVQNDDIVDGNIAVKLRLHNQETQNKVDAKIYIMVKDGNKMTDVSKISNITITGKSNGRYTAYINDNQIQKYELKINSQEVQPGNVFKVVEIEQDGEMVNTHDIQKQIIVVQDPNLQNTKTLGIHFDQNGDIAAYSFISSNKKKKAYFVTSNGIKVYFVNTDGNEIKRLSKKQITTLLNHQLIDENDVKLIEQNNKLTDQEERDSEKSKPQHNMKKKKTKKGKYKNRKSMSR